MSKTHKDKQFLDMADTFIALANDMCEEADKGKVSAIFLYAAARFNTYIVASSAANGSEFESVQKNATEYFMGEYKKMLDEHMADYTVNFNDFIRPGAGNKLVN